jgi:hypothetical protein
MEECKKIPELETVRLEYKKAVKALPALLRGSDIRTFSGFIDLFDTYPINITDYTDDEGVNDDELWPDVGAVEQSTKEWYTSLDHPKLVGYFKAYGRWCAFRTQIRSKLEKMVADGLVHPEPVRGAADAAPENDGFDLATIMEGNLVMDE